MLDTAINHEEGQFSRAVKEVWEHGVASTSFIQRRLGIGYNKAARIIERMEHLSIVSKANHVGKRTVRSPEDLRKALGIRAEVMEIVGNDEEQAAVLMRALLEGLRHIETEVAAKGPSLTPKQVEAMQKKKSDPNAPEFQSVNDHNYAVTADELRQFIEQFEHLEAEKRDLAEQQKDVMSEAKARGYDTKVLKKVIALRKRDKDDIAEEEAILELYKTALGMA